MNIVPQEVEYVDHMGSDLSVVNAARVSFGKFTKQLRDTDIKLIKYLASHKHWTPFAHTSLSLRIKCPIFVARQLGKHQVGLVWNEVSRRYVDNEPEFFLPHEWRGRPVNSKQGSNGILPPELQTYVFSQVDDYMDVVGRLYDVLIQDGVAPEQARMILPQNMMTEFIWTGSLVAFARICSLRLDPHSQMETQEIAREIASLCETHFPYSFSALLDNSHAS
jgi:thymidylate synthase (FAD)